MTTTTTTPRDGAQRKRETLARLAAEEDVWVATAGPDGVPCLVPLSLHWDDGTAWLSTRSGNPTGRNLRATGRVRLSLGSTRDVVLIDGTVETVTLEEMDPAVADAFAARCGWEPRNPRRSGTPYVYFRVTPVAVQAFHEAREMAGRHLMRDGRWLV